MTQIHAYVGFNGHCREAMNFYKENIGGELTLQPVEGSPMEAQCPPSMKCQILHSSLIKDGALLLMGSDMNAPGEQPKGSNIALSLSCSSEEEINRLFTKFSSEGTIIDPLKKQFWGALFGVCKDKYGTTWMLTYDLNSAN
jgi:PhnB protein